MLGKTGGAVISQRINIVQVDPYGEIFDELIGLIADSVQKAGIAVGGTRHRVLADWVNLFVGATALLAPQEISRLRNLPNGYLVFQLEPLDTDHAINQSNRPAYFEFLRDAKQVWDYSPSNVDFLVRLGLDNVRYIPVGYSPCLERIMNSGSRDIDILFYGSKTLRRAHILDALRERGFETVNLFDKYGETRDSYIARAKIQLNMHQFQTNHLEQLRISYLLNNRCFVVSETSDVNPYGDGMVFCDYDQLVERCAYYLKPKMEVERRRIAQLGYENLKLMPMASSIMKALSEITSSV
ncbi:MAG TPA: hypothetical protein VK148_26085 [Xanthobacteraceae bacterium]|jgi:hypothetical protein|nr:hypothetical protein [Xanthobacteraceae bacterium]